MAVSIYDKAILPEIAQKALDAVTKAWNAANSKGDQKAKDELHRQAEKIRAQYGYSGGAGGNLFIQVAEAAVKTVKDAAQTVANTVTQTVAQNSSNTATVASNVQTLSPISGSTVTSGTNTQTPISGSALPPSVTVVNELPEGSGELIPEEVKRPILYGGIFILAMMALKVMMGGNK